MLSRKRSRSAAIRSCRPSPLPMSPTIRAAAGAAIRPFCSGLFMMPGYRARCSASFTTRPLRPKPTAAALMGFGRKGRVVKDAQQRARYPGIMKSPEQKGRIAAPAAARIVGDIGKGEGRQERIAADRERFRDSIFERSEARIKASAIGPAELSDLAGQSF